MVESQSEEDELFSLNHRFRSELGIPDSEFYHFDTPCTLDNQLKMLLCAGFGKAAQVWRQENTTIVMAYK
jgi:hypothetical protein